MNTKKKINVMTSSKNVNTIKTTKITKTTTKTLSSEEEARCQPSRLFLFNKFCYNDSREEGVFMLGIKIHTKVKNNNLSYEFLLRRNIPYLIDGSKEEKETVLQYISQNSNCTFLQQKTMDTKLVQAHIIHISDKFHFSKYTSVADYIKQYTSDVDTVVKIYHIEDKNRYMSSLSNLEIIRLHLQIQMLRKPFLWIIEGNWQEQDEEVKHVVQSMLEKYIKNNDCYIIGTIDAQAIMPFFDYKNLNERNESIPYTNFLEENVVLQRTQISTPKMKTYSIFGTIRYIFYYLSVLSFTLFAFLYFFLFFSAQKDVKEAEALLSSTNQYPVIASFCVLDEDIQYASPYCAPDNEGQVKEILQRHFAFDVDVALYENLSLNFDDSSYFKHADGTKINAMYNNDIGYSNIYVYNEQIPATRGIVKEQYQESGIYVDETILQYFVEKESLQGATLHTTLKIPMYIQNQAQYNVIDEKEYNHGVIAYADYEVDIPIAGVLANQGVSASFVLTKDIYDQALDALGYGKPYDEQHDLKLDGMYNELLPVNDFVPYRPHVYLLLGDSREQANIIEQALFPSEFSTRTDAIATGTLFISNDYIEYIEMRKTTVRSMLLPFVAISLFLLAILFIWNCIVKIKKKYINLTKSSVYRKIFICLGSSVLVSSILIIAITILQNQHQSDLTLLASEIFFKSNYNDTVLELYEIVLSLAVEKMDVQQYVFLILVPLVFFSIYYVVPWIPFKKKQFSK